MIYVSNIKYRTRIKRQNQLPFLCRQLRRSAFHKKALLAMHVESFTMEALLFLRCFNYHFKRWTSKQWWLEPSARTYLNIFAKHTIPFSSSPLFLLTRSKEKES